MRRHNDVSILIRFLLLVRPQLPGALPSPEMKLYIAIGDRAQKVEKVLGIEPYLDGVALVIGWDALLALAGF